MRELICIVFDFGQHLVVEQWSSNLFRRHVASQISNHLTIRTSRGGETLAQCGVTPPSREITAPCDIGACLWGRTKR